MNPFFIRLCSLLCITIVACNKSSVDYNSTQKAPISIEFDNIVGTKDLQLNTAIYTNGSGETYAVSALKYFVSNFSFTKTDGTKIIIPQDSCYFLINEQVDSSHSLKFSLPEGQYTKIDFLLGVDSLRNTMDIAKRQGVLDPSGAAAGMYWSWNSGYIFFKLEGTAPVSTQANNIFQYHIGLYGGYNAPTINNLKWIQIDLAARGTANVKQGKSPNVHLLVDINKLFNGQTAVSIAQNPVVMNSVFSATIANNFSYMFQHDHTEN